MGLFGRFLSFRFCKSLNSLLGKLMEGLEGLQEALLSVSKWIRNNQA